MGAGGSQEAEWTLKASVPAGTYHFVLDSIIIRPVDVTFELLVRHTSAADTPGLEDATYDAILLAEVDHYFTDPATWLREAGKALKPGGRIVISNRIYHRAQTMDAARKAGLVLKSETNPVPTHFVAVFVVDSK